MPMKSLPRVLEFWGGPQDGKRITTEEFIASYPKGIASFPIPGTTLLHVYKKDPDDPSGKVLYLGEFTPEAVTQLS